MVWTGSDQYRLAPALLTLLHQLEARYPGQQWVNSPQTGTIGDAAHFAEGSASDHTPWLDNTVRALDVAADTDAAGLVPVHDAPDCEALFAMVNRMYADHDPRVWPNGYAIYLYRITDWDNPGGFHPQQGDPHLYHLHISVSQNPAGFNSTAPWPLPGGESTQSGHAVPIKKPAPLEEPDMLVIYPKGKPDLPALLTGNGAQHIQDASTIAQLTAAGVKAAVFSQRDYNSMIKAGR